MNPAIFLLVFGAWIVWCAIGCVLITYADEEDHRLTNWVLACPLPVFGVHVALTFWPLILLLWFRPQRDERH